MVLRLIQLPIQARMSESHFFNNMSIRLHFHLPHPFGVIFQIFLQLIYFMILACLDLVLQDLVLETAGLSGCELLMPHLKILFDLFLGVFDALVLLFLCAWSYRG